MSRVAMFGESPTLFGDGLVIHDGVPSTVTRVGGVGTTPQGNTSAFAHRVMENQTAYPVLISKRWGTPVTEGWIRFHFFGNGFNRASSRRMFGLRLGAPGASVPILNFTQRDFSTNFEWGINAINGLGTNIGTTASNAIQSAAVQLIEVNIRLDPANGVCDLYVDGALQISYAGPLVGPGGETTFDTFCFGAGVPLAGADPGVYDQGATTDNGARYTIDNFACNDVLGTINNGRIGNGIIVALTPNGAGGFSQLTNTHGDSADNFRHASRFDEGWVFPTGVGQRDSYLLSRPDLEFGGVNALMYQAQVAKNGPTYNNVRFSLRPAGQVDYQEGSTDAIPLDAVGDINADCPLIQRIVEENQNTSAAFTIAELQGAEAGLAFEA